MPDVLKLFISYSHEDRAWCDRVATHLAGLERGKIIQVWYDRDIPPGQAWSGEISKELNDADLVLCLVSAIYNKSDYCAAEAEHTYDRQEESRKVRLLPILLSECDLEGTVFEKSQVYRPCDLPLGASTGDPDARLADIAKMVSRTAVEFSGTRPKRLLPEERLKQFMALLHNFCDRGQQWDYLRYAMDPAKWKPNRPFLIIMRGTPQDSMDYYLRRLVDVLFPRVLHDKPGMLSPLGWPDFVPNRTPFELFQPRLESILSVNGPAETQAQMNDALKALSAINIAFSSLAVSDSPEQPEKVFDAYIQMWEEWPKLPEGRLLVPVLALEDRAGASWDTKIGPRLEALKFENRPALNGVVLPPMKPVRLSDFKDWIRHEEVRPKFESPEQAVEKADAMETDFPAAMNPVAKVHLPRLLEYL